MQNNNNIEISNLKKHFLFDSYNEKYADKDKENKKYHQKLVNKQFYSMNELTISKIIKKIQDYSNYFLIVEDYEVVNIGELSGSIVKKLEIENNFDTQIHLYKYTKEQNISFHSFLFQIMKPKHFFSRLLYSFSTILESLFKLQKQNICYFHLSTENIYFYREKPRLHNFQYSIYTEKLDEEYITQLIKKISNYSNKPFEIHILYYFILNNICTISYSFIEEVCEVFMKNNSILQFFSDKLKESYKNMCIDSLKKYINKPRSFIITEILKSHEKWDVYGVSIIYLHILGHFIRVFSLNQDFFNNLFLEICKNIHPDPEKRGSLQNSIKNLKILLINEPDWGYMNLLDMNKIELFLSNLQE